MQTNQCTAPSVFGHPYLFFFSPFFSPVCLLMLFPSVHLAFPSSHISVQGSIFFPLPDGTGQLYNLSGTADPPKHTGSVVQEIPCKTTHTELLTVYNWLRRPQRFRADTQMIRPEKLERSVYMYGVEYIDVPALGKKDYKLNFYSFKEGSFLAKVCTALYIVCLLFFLSPFFNVSHAKLLST